MLRQRSALACVLAPVVVASSAAALAGAAPLVGCVPSAASTLRSAPSGARLYALDGTLFGCLGARRTMLGPMRATPAHPGAHVVLYALRGEDAAVAWPRWASTR